MGRRDVLGFPQAHSYSQDTEFSKKQMFSSKETFGRRYVYYVRCQNEEQAMM
jgi:hypothetical protein